MWSAPREWPGETVFVLASGPSVKQLDLSLIKGRRVIAVKSSCVTYPQADILFFADGRWWREKRLRPSEFAGLIVTTAAEVKDPRVLHLRKILPTALATRPDEVALARTSTTGAINLAVHYGASRIVLVGVDGKMGADGSRHCHGLPWPWKPHGKPVEATFKDQAAEYANIAPSAARMGVEIVNANPDSAINVWPKLSFEECLD